VERGLDMLKSHNLGPFLSDQVLLMVVVVVVVGHHWWSR